MWFESDSAKTFSPVFNPKGEDPFLARFWTLGRPLWMQYLSKKSQIFGELVV
jgi:hypothetical protein